MRSYRTLNRLEESGRQEPPNGFCRVVVKRPDCLGCSGLHGRNTRGASIVMAMLAVMIATVAAAIVIASASAVTSSASQTYTTERAYLSVDSAVRSIEEGMKGDSFKKEWIVHASRGFLDSVFEYEDLEPAEYSYVDVGAVNPFRDQVSNLVYKQMLAGGASDAKETVVISTYIDEDKSKVDPVIATFSMSNTTGTSSAGFSIKVTFQSARYVQNGSNWTVEETDGYAATLLMKIGSFDGGPTKNSSYLTKERLEELKNQGRFGEIMLALGDILDSISNWVMGSSRNQYYLYSSTVSWDSSDFKLQKGAK